MSRIMLGVPCGAGPAWSPQTAFAILKASAKHEVKIVASIGSWLNFQILWAQALTAAAAGEIDRFCMLHADIEVGPGWIDTLEEVREEFSADLVSVIVPQKDATGVSSSGIGDEEDGWTPHRRFTMREVWAPDFPETFDASICPGKYILHNNACWIADLRQEKFRQTEEVGGRHFLMAHFNFPYAVEKIGDKFIARGESEDWYFSRCIHKLGIRSFITRRLALNHMGSAAYPNSQAWGTEEHDSATKEKWGHAAED